jgi:adenylate cyclase
MIQFHSFQSRIAFFFVGLILLVQGLVFFSVDAINTRHARAQIEQALAAGAGNFRRMMDLRTVQLLESVRILSSDFAFKTAFATGDEVTVRSALANQGGRVGADIMILVSLDRSVLVDTHPMRGAYPAGLGQLVREAEQHHQASAVVILDGRPHQLIVSPVLGPDPIAWLVAGFVLDDRLAQSMQQLLKLDVSFYDVGSHGPALVASSLPPEARTRLAQFLPATIEKERVVASDIDGSEVLNFATRIGSQGGDSVYVLLQRSVDEELKPFQEVRNIVLWLSIGGLVLSLIGAFFVARTVTRPVHALVDAARGVERGDYTHAVQVRQQDEIGELAAAFNRMLKGLAERDKVRDLFGRFVPRAVAEQAIAGSAVLGGEDRQVTVLFSDLRNFTSFSERRSPQEVVSLLNTYFTRMSEVIEANHGMVDKFLGDGVMAIFGAPAASEDDAGNALQAALDMRAALEQLNDVFAEQGLPRLDIGIGINTGVMVAGNMGSPSRYNYTVIGDGVNLAARIEGLTKRKEYHARIIATDATVRTAKRSFNTRSLGLVEIRGRQEKVMLHAIVEAESGSVGEAPATETEFHPG